MQGFPLPKLWAEGPTHPLLGTRPRHGALQNASQEKIVPRQAATIVSTPPVPPEIIADVESAGLRYVSDDQPGLRRRRKGKGFVYRDDEGHAVQDHDTLARIRSLSIPPAWTEVWIAPRSDSHIQATGRDARGRKQYRYHPEFREARDSTKYEHIIDFARALPGIRAHVARDIARAGLPREKVIATVVHLLETTLIRVGNEDYAKDNKSFGLTTLRNPHVKVNGTELRFNFRGKSGKTWRLQIKDRRVAKIIRACQDIPGQQLFQYTDDRGTPQDISSADVNDYLRAVTRRDITAKDFRTWAGTVLAAMALQEFETIDGRAKTKKSVRAAIERVAMRLGNTVTICRKCYVHPEIVTSYLSGTLCTELTRRIGGTISKNLAGLNPQEAAVLVMLERRLKSGGAFAEAARHLNLKAQSKGKPKRRPRPRSRRAPREPAVAIGVKHAIPAV